ncbi:hypothetical protein [uncultured phage]|nr:hypothetical protein [uncultured phage]
MNETITVYVTKYALTIGIIKCSGKISDGRFVPSNLYRLYMLMVIDGFKSTEFVLTEAEAQKVFEEKRLKAIKQTEKKLEKLKNLKMKIKEY